MLARCSVSQEKDVGISVKIAFAKGIWNPPVVHGKVDKILIIGICSFGVQ
jgi:hypothetical protein